ncbi:NUDIX hydrolase domain-like protein [Stachybotrys elegans]|uniref:NUDIX hydrolase domain-like protein n=1 Tax=Stachybotrys elegans TaxID=80388 RepID=A0A8K0WS98_9HYPO|nr:NUDIX hydrolase domain-like protein [Stachybotrys elegans]
MSARHLIDLLALVDNVPSSFEHDWTPYYRLLIPPDPRPHGFIHPSTIALMPWPPSITIDHAARTVSLPSSPSPAEALQAAVDAAIAADVFPVLAARHSEPYRLLGARTFVQLERFAVSLFGIAARGAHLTGYVRGENGAAPRIWVARRSATLFTYPGMLDSTVAGGVKASHTPMDCIVAESMEEACLSRVRERVRPAGVITALSRGADDLVHGDVVHVFDLEMDEGELPRPGDDEVAEFILMDCQEVRRRMLAGEFKPNVCSVLVDFMVRHGIVTPETEGEGQYVDICSRLRRKLPMPISSDI